MRDMEITYGSDGNGRREGIEWRCVVGRVEWSIGLLGNKVHGGWEDVQGRRMGRKLVNEDGFERRWLIFGCDAQLWSLVPQEKRDEYLAEKKGDTAPVLDLLPLGYSKVLGKGRIPDIPMVVRARFFSKEAERKIKEAGGVVELVA